MSFDFGVPIASGDLGERIIEEPVSIDSPQALRSSGRIMWSNEVILNGLVDLMLLSLDCNTTSSWFWKSISSFFFYVFFSSLDMSNFVSAFSRCLS